MNNDVWLWHRELGHASVHTIAKLSRKDLVKGLPKIKIEKDFVCDACVREKHSKSSFQRKNLIFTTRPLEPLHMDLFGPVGFLMQQNIKNYSGRHVTQQETTPN